MTAAASSFAEESIATWHQTTTDFPTLGRQYNENEQREREILFDQALERAEAEMRSPPETALDREDSYARITSEAARLASLALDLDDPYIALLLREKFPAIGRGLARSARIFDPAVSSSDILQACRNAWTACGFQPLLGKGMQLTPAIFGYSMLYPYSDNYLDDPNIPPEEKLAFSSRFRQRLQGEPVAILNKLEASVWRLVSFIESQYDRLEHPQVYDCLLDIHRAQEDSLCQLTRAAPAAGTDFLKLTVTKGGTSVLADAYLAAGSLTECEAKFAFAWGVVLQMADDLDDLLEDRKGGFVNVFSQAAESRSLDEVTNRTFNFAQSVMKLMHALPNGCSSFKELLRKNANSLLIRAVSRSGEFYTEQYLAELETYSPLRFSFLRSRHDQLAHRAYGYPQFFESLASGEPGVSVVPDCVSSEPPGSGVARRTWIAQRSC